MKVKGKKFIWWILSILWLAVIFSQSCMPATQSEAESAGFLSILLQWFPFMTMHMIRKLAHFMEFALLGLLLSQSIPTKLIHPLFLGLLCAMGDETIQLFIPGRSGQVSDVWIDFAGVTTAVVLTYTICRLKKSRQTRK